jgi:sulfite oxidase
LKNDFRQYEVLCALQCAGNRRHEMRTKIKEVQGIDWFSGAVMNCRWKGPLLRDVITKAGINTNLINRATGDYKGHAAFACYEQQVQEDSWYGSAIGLQRAMDADAEVIIALEMNAEPLTAEHGAPVRIIVPGVAGARSVKWLNRITIQQEDSMNFYQQHDYKVLPPEAVDKESAENYWHQLPPMMDMPINSIIGIPDDGEVIKANEEGLVDARGYALPHGNDGPVRKVEVSGDNGKTWTEAQLNFGGYGCLDSEESRRKIKWAWCLWNAKVKVEKGKGQGILCRATDVGGNTQEEQQSTWNLRGVGYNGWGRVSNLTVL